MPQLQVTTTVEAREDADRLARSLVEERLAACVQVVGPITSTYWWQGAVEVAQEWICLIKTTDERFEALAARIKQIHSYDVPEITAVPLVKGSPEYLGWIDAETVAR
jgi:periplasmic divalent cation tolerance protein